MSNTVNPSSGLGSSELNVTIIPVQENTVSVLRAKAPNISDSVIFEQYAIISIDPDGSAVPICDDISYEINADKIEYHIEVDGKMVYAGYAYRYPDEEENVKIELNDILSDYLENHISFTEGLNEMKGFYKTFKIVTPNASEEIQVYNS